MIADTCDCAQARAENEYATCAIHVHCDEWCGALQEPVSLAEHRAALEHWRYHGYLAGCSHAC